jgi:hypothetical protein
MFNLSINEIENVSSDKIDELSKEEQAMTFGGCCCCCCCPQPVEEDPTAWSKEE